MLYIYTWELFGKGRDGWGKDFMRSQNRMSSLSLNCPVYTVSSDISFKFDESGSGQKSYIYSRAQCWLVLGNITVVNESSLSACLTGYFELILPSVCTSNKVYSPGDICEHLNVSPHVVNSSQMPACHILS